MLTPTMLSAADRVRTFPPDKLPELREAFAEIAASDARARPHGAPPPSLCARRSTRRVPAAIR